MESNGKLKEISIKTRTCYYCDDISRFEDFDLDNILMDEKSCKNVLVDNILYKTMGGCKTNAY